MLRRVSLVRTGDSEERITSIVRLTRIGELGTTLAVTSNRSTLRKKCYMGKEELNWDTRLRVAEVAGVGVGVGIGVVRVRLNSTLTLSTERWLLSQ
jgi:hypothetical protein